MSAMSAKPAYFNPLPRKEGDYNTGAFFGDVAISIHSLVKRETSKTTVLNLPQKNFNPLPRKEGDSKYS